MSYTKIIFAIVINFIFCTQCFASENVFYVLRHHTSDRMCTFEDSMNSLKKNYRKIDILIPQAYHINETGLVTGEIEPDIFNFATQHKMKIMPLITNSQFDKKIAHEFLSNPDAINKAISSLIALCRENNFYGVQLDFEMIAKEDRDLLTHFYQQAANQLHKNGYKVSFAIAPITTDTPHSLFQKKLLENWEAAYDFKQLGKAADFVSIMAYNQHGIGTTPGPSATEPWTNQVVKYALKYIPANKISIGIPDFSMYWYTGKSSSGKIAVRIRAMDFTSAMKLIHHNKSRLVWDNNAKIYYSIFSRDDLNEYIFVEDIKSFKAKYALIKKYHLRGISVFDLGTEDSRIWEVM